MEGLRLVSFNCCAWCASEVRQAMSAGKSLIVTRTTADFSFCEVCSHFTETEYFFVGILLEDGKWEGGTDVDGGNYGYKEIQVLPVYEVDLENEDPYEKERVHLKKIRRRLEDYLRKTKPENVLSIAQSVGIKLTL